MSDEHGPIEDLSYEELRMRVSNEFTDDLVVFINRWSSLKRATNDASSLVRVWMTKLAPHWKGESGRQCMAELDKLAKWTEQIGIAASNNLVANEDLHKAVLRAQRDMKTLDTQPNSAPPPPALVTLDGERDRRPPAERDSRQPTAARIAKTLAWAYTNHTTNVNPIPEEPSKRDPGPGLPMAGLGGGGSAGSPPIFRQPGSGSTSGTPAYDPGPTLAGRAAVPPAASDTGSTGATVRPGPATGLNTSAAGVPGWASGSLPGSRSTSGGSIPGGGQQTANTSRGSTSPTSGNTTPKGGGQTPPAGGRPPTGMHGAPLAPSGGAAPRDDQRRGRGTELREDPKIWLEGIRKPAGTIGTPRRPAASDEQDDYIPEPPPPTNSQLRDEQGFPSRIPDGEFSTNEGARINIRMGPKDK